MFLREGAANDCADDVPNFMVGRTRGLANPRLSFRLLFDGVVFLKLLLTLFHDDVIEAEWQRARLERVLELVVSEIWKV